MKHVFFIRGLFIEAYEVFKDKRQSYISESLYNIIEMQNDYM